MTFHDSTEAVRILLFHFQPLHANKNIEFQYGAICKESYTRLLFSKMDTMVDAHIWKWKEITSFPAQLEGSRGGEKGRRNIVFCSIKWQANVTRVSNDVCQSAFSLAIETSQCTNHETSNSKKSCQHQGCQKLPYLWVLKDQLYGKCEPMQIIY